MTSRDIHTRDYLWHQEEYTLETTNDTKRNTYKTLPMTPRGIHIRDYLWHQEEYISETSYDTKRNTR